MDRAHFDRLTRGDKVTVVAVAHYLIERVGAYYGTNTDAVTDAMGLVEDLHLSMSIDLRERLTDASWESVPVSSPRMIPHRL